MYFYHDGKGLYDFIDFFMTKISDEATYYYQF